MHFLPNLQLAMEEGKMPDPCLITTSDVFNRGLTPGMLGALLEIKAWKGKYVSFSNGFTMATGLFTLDVVRAMNVTLGRFDAGKLKIASEFIADEHLLRQAEFPCLMLDVMSHAPDFTSKPLIHLSRSTLQWFDKWYPETVTI